VRAALRLGDAASWLLLAPLSLAGLGTSSYLTYSHYADRPTVCAGIGSCEFVQTSAYSAILGVPVAAMGLAFFIGFGGLTFLRLALWNQDLEWIRPAAFSMALGGTAFVGYLTFVELFVIDAICIWCVATAGITVACLLVVVLGMVSAAYTRR
jgi:uncharacterized membrane protein